MPLSGPFQHLVLRLTSFAETYLLSTMYLWQAVQSARGVVRQVVLPEHPLQGLGLVELIRDIDMGAVFLLIGVLLLLSKPPKEGPRKWEEVFVPLAVTLFFLAYNPQVQALWPACMHRALVSERVQIPCAMASLILGAAGSLVALWGVLSLGRSFGIFVAVREVVIAGPYRYVRHPIYSGYLLLWLSMILVNLSVAVLVLVAMHTVLMVYRARLEERRLAAASEEYRAYCERTGFLFPRFG